jgi:hypothetical protein
MKAKMNLCAYEMVSVLQNISKNRESKKITIHDIRYAATAGFLTYFGGGIGQYSNGKQHLYKCGGYVALLGMLCVLGTGENRAKCLWNLDTDWFELPTTSSYPLIHNQRLDYLTVNYFSDEVDSRSIYKDLTIKAGQIKILIDVFMFVGGGVIYYDAQGRDARKLSLRERFKFLLLEPRLSSSRGFMNTVLIFTPNPGLFDEVAPSN